MRRTTSCATCTPRSKRRLSGRLVRFDQTAAAAAAASWVDGCTGLVKEYGQLRQANTASKFMEQEYNVAARFSALLASQATGLIGPLENIQVDFSYWISQKQAPPEA